MSVPRKIVNMEASVKTRLLNKSREMNKSFSEILQYYGIERLLYRFSKSKYKDKIILKGALMFVVWGSKDYRMTRDIDFLGKIENDLNKIKEMVKDICILETEADGVKYDPENIKAQDIMEDNEYLGIRLKVPGYLGKARFVVQLDFGFGDKIYPKAKKIKYPVLLNDMHNPELMGYPKETVIAEKYHAMVHHGMLNSRMKDYYDIWLLFNIYDFDKEELSKAIQYTFKSREKELVKNPIALSDSFAKDPEKSAQWKVFRRNMELSNAPEDLMEVVQAIRKYLFSVLSFVI